jgi:hypothetical protein
MITAIQGITFCNPVTSASCLDKYLIGLTPVGAVTAAGSEGKSAIGSIASDAVQQLAQAVQNAVSQVLAAALTLWVHVPSPNLQTDPVPRALQQDLWPWTVSVALIGFIVVAGRMALTRKGTALADLGKGILVMACTTAAGTILPTLLLQAGDDWSTWILEKSTGGDFSARFGGMFGGIAIAGGGAGAGFTIIVGIVFLLVGLIQAALLLFRMGSVVVLAGVLPLAAAGQLTPMTSGWFKTTASWMLAFIFWKPAGAAVMAAGFYMFGSGTSVLDIITGLAIIILSLVALPSLMKFFNFAGEIGSSGGSLLGTAIGAATALGAMRGGGIGGSAAGQAASLSNALGGPGGGNSSSGKSGPAPGGSPSGATSGGGQGKSTGQAPGSSTGGIKPGQQAAGSRDQSSGPLSSGALTGTGGGQAAAGPQAASGIAAAASAPLGAAGKIILGGAAAAKQAGQSVADSAGPPKGAQP